MTYPVIASVTQTLKATNGLSHVVALPATVDAGDLLLVVMAFDGQPTLTWDNTTAGTWTLLHDTKSGSAVTLAAYWKVADGTEDGLSLTIGLSTTEQSVAEVFRITGALSIECGTAVTSGTGTSLDPPALAPSWGAADTYWLAIGGINNGVTVSVDPTGYAASTTVSSSGSAGSESTLTYTGRTALVASENPSAFTISASQSKVAQTYGIRPAVVSIDGTAAGTSTATGDSRAEKRVDGTAAGTSTATGASKAEFRSDGTAAGTSTATGASKAEIRSGGTAAGTSTVVGDGVGTGGNTAGGTAAGTSTATGDSRAEIRSGGTAAGTSTATGDSVSLAPAYSGGIAAGSSTAVGDARVEARSGGLAAGRSFVVGGTPSLEPARPDPILLPLVPNWVTTVKKVLTFKTEIFTSRSGKEQRRALRTTPRKTITFTSLLNGDLLRAFERLLVRSHAQPHGLADVVRGVRSTTSMASGDNSITMPHVPDWLGVGKLVILSHRRRTRMLSVLAIDGLTITFSGTTDITWPVGVRISPVLEGQLASTVRSTRVTDNVAQIPVDFDVAPALESVDDGEVDYSAWMNGREILLLKPNWTRSPQISYSHDIETVDYGRGRIANFAPIQFGTLLSQATYLQRSTADIEGLEQFFCRMKGMRGEFLLPTWADDLPLKEDIVTGSAVLKTAGSEVYFTYLNEPVYRSLMIVLNNGWVIPRAVIDVDPSLGDSIVTLDRPLPYGIALSQINKVCWMPVTRFASDSLTVEYTTDEVGQVVLSTMSLPAEEAEGDDTPMDEIAEYLLSLYGWSMLEGLLFDPLEHAVNVRYPQIAPI